MSQCQDKTRLIDYGYDPDLWFDGSALSWTNCQTVGNAKCLKMTFEVDNKKNS